MVDPGVAIDYCTDEFEAMLQRIRNDIFANCTESVKAMMILHLMGFAAQQIVESGIVCSKIYFFIHLGDEILKANIGINPRAMNILRNAISNTSKVMSIYLTDRINANIAAQEVVDSLPLFYNEIIEIQPYNVLLREIVVRVGHLRK